MPSCSPASTRCSRRPSPPATRSPTLQTRCAPRPAAHRAAAALQLDAWRARARAGDGQPALRCASRPRWLPPPRA
eukprot:4492690-Prymnesium_polylepis.2